MKRGSFELMKKMNQQIILKIISSDKSTSRAKIAEITGLSPAAVSNNVKELLEMGLLKETEHGESRGGRKPVLLEMNPEGAYFIGLEWGIAEVRGVLLDLNKKIVSRCEEKVDSFQLESFVDLSRKIVDELINQLVETERIYGLGVGVHGMVDPERGYSLFAPHFGWRDLPIKERLEEEFQIPVFIDNDVRVMALAEKWNAKDNFLLINTGPGIGAAIVFDGKLHYGRDYSAGEFGHMTVMKDGPLCSCGNRGCLEALISTDNLVYHYNPDIAGEITKNEISEKWLDILADAREGREKALEIINMIIEYLGMGLSNLVNLLNPDEIVLAGDFTLAADLLLPLLKEELKAKTLAIPGRELSLVVTDFGEWLGAVGGAAVVLEKFFLD